jgi:peptidyl-prolyl cis-trans isomerase SurA
MCPSSSLLAFACAALMPLLARAEVVDRVVAVVGREAIALSELRDRQKVTAPSGGRPPTSEAQAKLDRDTLAAMVEERLIAREAERQHLTVEDAEIDRAFGLIAEQQHLTREQLKTAVAQLTDPALYRAYLRAQILDQRVTNAKLADRMQKLAGRPAAEREAARDRERAAWLDEARRGMRVEVRL